MKEIKQKEAYIQSLKNGTSRVEAAEAAGICTTTVWNWRKRDEQFQKDEEEALESRITIVEDALLNNAVGKGEYTNKEGKKIIDRGNVIAQIFYLKNRGKDKWKDKQEVEFKVPDTIRIKAFIQAGAEPVIKEEEEIPEKEKEVQEEAQEEIQGEDTKEIETVL